MLPFLLTGCLVILHRIRQGAASSVVEPRQLLLLSSIAIISHPVLDTLNTYGVRWLMPFSDQWFYGDTLFIVDPWVSGALGLGLYYSARRQKANRANSTRPVWLSLALVTLYVCGMALSGRAAASIISQEVASNTGASVQGVMAGPVPLNPLTRKFVAEQDREYRVGAFRWLERPQVNFDEVITFSRKPPAHPALPVAAESPLGRRFLGWARFPAFQIQQVGRGRFMVNIVDLRYARRPGEAFGTVSIPVTLPTASGPSPDIP